MHLEQVAKGPFSQHAQLYLYFAVDDVTPSWHLLTYGSPPGCMQSASCRLGVPPRAIQRQLQGCLWGQAAERPLIAAQSRHPFRAFFCGSVGSQTSAKNSIQMKKIKATDLAAWRIKGGFPA